MITFSKKAKVKQTDVSTLRRFESPDGYAVIERKSGLPGPRWLAVVQTGNGEYVLSRHPTRESAERACDTHYTGRKTVTR
jgi:hypothetical protein